MFQRTGLLLLVGGAALVLLAVVIALRQQRALPRIEQENVPETALAVQTSADLPSDVLQPEMDTREADENVNDVGGEAGADIAKSPARLDRRTRFPLPDEYFEALYGDYDLESLREELAKTLTSYNAAKQEAFRERFDAGQYEVFPVDKDGSFALRQQPDEPFARVRRLRDHPDEAHVATLPFGDYSHVYEQGDKWRWLQNAIDERKREN